METLSDKGYEVLCMDDSIDEFCVKMLAKYNDKEFKSIADADLGLDSEDEKEEIKKLRTTRMSSKHSARRSRARLRRSS